MRTSAPLLSLLLSLPLGAQDDVLGVERLEDLRGRDAAARMLKAVRAGFVFEEIAPRDLCRLFATLTGDKLSFSPANKAVAEGEAITLDLRHASLWTAMFVVQGQTGLRFVYRGGVVFLVPKEDFAPLTYLAIYDLRAQTTRLRSFPGPELRLPGSDDERPLFPEPEETEATVSGFTADGIETLLRENVTPEAWGEGGVKLTNDNGLFLVRHTPQGQREVRALLVELGLVPPPPVWVRRPAAQRLRTAATDPPTSRTRPR